YVNCSNNINLESFCVKNGKLMNESYLNFSGNPKLKYICADDKEINLIQNMITNYGYTGCHTNSYCSFTPSNDFYIIEGSQKIDYNNNGCDAFDISIPNLKFKITSNNSGTFITNSAGNYSLPVPSGTHRITPVFENSNYFSISPTTVNIVFPASQSPYMQNFCIKPNGSYTDLEVSLLPIDAARPGFDSSYKLIYKNKGNTIQSGGVSLTFNDAVIDFITADLTISNQNANKLSWNFSNLKPFESKEITFKVKVNAPTATPAVNNGDVLIFTANITSVATDETPKDNTFTLNQTVVGSYDPNDKTCLEGSIITPSLIGEYVHYMIRFENTGTYAAQNIVVKDMIDLSKFDISTLIPTSSSHSFVTKISEGNKVEFIFENINLPFDDANNDGYVAFKIKTKPTLKVGDSFTNEANIYFDYNFPILTNKATSKFQTTLSNPDFEFSNYFTLYPNPANNVLNINATQNIEIQSLAIYDILGQLVIAVPNAKSVSNIDVSKLRTGTYFIKVKSDKGSSGMKFIKN
ncbi:T9SS type A sorting domain-containing protein, partial [Flavobacterium chungangense]